MTNVDERAKMKTLLKYLVEHNREHSQEVKDWAVKAADMGEADVADEMMQAAKTMDEANGLLEKSLRKLEGM
jgi:hypothetical protein